MMRKKLDYKGKPGITTLDRKAKVQAAKTIKQLFINQKAKHGATLYIGEKIIYI